MSYSTLLAIYPGEKVEDIEELRNSHGSAPIVWDAMCQRYEGSEPFRCMFDGSLNRLWPRWSDQSIPEHHRAVLMMTYDHSWVAKANYARAAADIEAWLRDFHIDAKYVNHWPHVAALLKSDPPYPGFAIYQTSVSDNPWHGPWDDEKEAYGPPPWEETSEIYADLASAANEFAIGKKP